MDNEYNYTKKQLEIEEEQLEISRENLRFKKTSSSFSSTISIIALITSFVAVATSIIIPIGVKNEQMRVDIEQNCRDNAERYYTSYIQNSNFFSIVETLSSGEKFEYDPNFAQHFYENLNTFLVYGNNIDGYNISVSEKERIKDLHRPEILQLLDEVKKCYNRDELKPSIENIIQIVSDLEDIF